MKVLVQKFGGTSVATPESREFVFKKIAAARKACEGLVVVVSAMGRKGAPYATDTLLDLVRLDFPNAKPRELDLLFACGEIISGVFMASALGARGIDSVFLTGRQAGIITTSDHGDASILRVDTEKVITHLRRGIVVVVAGGQGATESGEITSLGRGGSDTTACALGVALEASSIDIFTDVNGVYTADPRVVPDARLLQRISYDSCCDLARAGAKVMHPRSVETAALDPRIPLYVKSTFTEDPGTLIGQKTADIGKPIGVAVLKNQNVPAGASLRDKFAKVTVVIEGRQPKAGYLERLVDVLRREGHAIVSAEIVDGSPSVWIDGDGTTAARAAHSLLVRE